MPSVQELKRSKLLTKEVDNKLLAAYRYRGLSLLFFSTAFGCDDLTARLLELGVAVDQRASIPWWKRWENTNPLEILCYRGCGNPSRIPELLHQALELTEYLSQTYTKRRNSLLHIACQGTKSQEIIEELLNAGINIGTRNSAKFYHETALMCAAAIGNLDAVKILLHRGASSTARNSEDLNALMLACFKGHATVVDVLRQQDGLPFIALQP